MQNFGSKEVAGGPTLNYIDINFKHFSQGRKGYNIRRDKSSKRIKLVEVLKRGGLETY